MNQSENLEATALDPLIERQSFKPYLARAEGPKGPKGPELGIEITRVLNHRGRVPIDYIAQRTSKIKGISYIGYSTIISGSFGLLVNNQ